MRQLTVILREKLLELNGNDKIDLIKALQAKGLHLEDERLYPPRGTFWLEGNADLPRRMIERMYEKLKDTLDKMPEI